MEAHASFRWGKCQGATRRVLAARSEERNGAQPELHPGKCVLVCEDEEMTVMLCRRACRAAGYEVVGAAATGTDAIAMARDLRPDVIIMDINMPGLDGIMATRQTMKERPVPILILTGYVEASIVDEAMEAGAAGYFAKPITSEQLAPALRAVMSAWGKREA